MRTTREAVIAALISVLNTAVFSQAVNGATTWRSVSRKLKLFDEVPPAQRPALFVTEHDENTSFQSENLPSKLTMSLNLFIYMNGKGASVPAIDLNIVMDALDAALAPDYTGKQTLGGEVSHCRIEGRVMKDPGDLDGDGLLWVPIRIYGP